MELGGITVEYADIDATAIHYENHFDIIVFKSMITSIGENDHLQLQRKIFAGIHKALKPGGKVLFAENLAGSRLHQWMRKRFTTWGSGCRYLNMEEMRSMLSGFSSVDLKATGVMGAMGRSEGQRNALAAVDQALVNHISPKSWKYIAYGMAQK